MKRLFTISAILALAVALCVLAACSRADTTADTPTFNGADATTETPVSSGTAETPAFPEQSPNLYLELVTEGGPTQRIQAIQLLTNWFWDGGGYMLDSLHPLQLHQDSLADATLYLVGESAEVELFLTEGYPPPQVSATRWRVDFADSPYVDDNVFGEEESVEVVDNKIILLSSNNEGFSYIYEIRAEWPEHGSLATYAFHLTCAEEWVLP